MTREAINAALRVRARDYAARVLPGGVVDGRDWVRGEHRVAVGGLKAGQWNGNRPLWELSMAVNGWTEDEALIEAATFLGVDFDVPEERANNVISAKFSEAELASVGLVNGNGHAAHEPDRVEGSPRVDRPKVSYLPDVQRLLPHSVEAEEAIISSFMQWPTEVGALCVEKGIAAGHFYMPGFAVLIDVLIFLWSERVPSEFVTVMQILRDEKKLEMVGGASEVARLSCLIPTPANTSYYLGILIEKWTLREAIQIGARVVKRAYEDQDQAEDVVEELRRTAANIADRRVHVGIAELLGPRAFDVARPPAEPVPVFKLRDVVVATSGNLMAIQSKAKVGKSALLGAMLAATMNGRGDTLCFESSNPEGHAMIHFDTEQSPWDHHQGMMRVLRRSSAPAAPAWLRSYRVADLPMRTRLNLVRQEIERAALKHGGILAVVLDGIGDLCADPNDPEEAFALIDVLHQLAIRFSTVIVCVLHENPGSEIGKTRGHLGSQLERKAETNLRLEKDAEGVTVVWTERARHAHLPKQHGVRFVWNDELKMHVSTEDAFVGSGVKKAENGGLRSNAKILSAKAQLGRYFANGKTVRRPLLASMCGIKGRTFDDYWSRLRSGGWIVQNKSIKSVWEASEEWATELEADYPDDVETGVNG